MWLVLCNSSDHAALWAARRLSARGFDPITVLTPELLHYSIRWEHRLQPDGSATVAFTLADGREIEGGAIRGVLNRIPSVPVHLVEHLVHEDRGYAQQEWTALHMSWLASLPVPVLNLPVAEGLCGAWRHRSEWVWLASQAGLEVAEYEQQVPATFRHRPFEADLPVDVQTVLAIDGRGIGPVTDAVADACGRLGVLSKTRILGVHLDARTGAFLTAFPSPDLRVGGEAFIDALSSALRGTG